MSDPLERVARVRRVPRETQVYTLLHSPGSDESVTYWPLDDAGWVVWLHYTPQGSRACIEPAEECEWCSAKEPCRLFRAGYLPVFVDGEWKPRVAYFTQNALDCNPSFTAGLILGGLRGWLIKARRGKGGKRAPMFADLEKAPKKLEVREKVIDMEEFMRTLLCASAVRLEKRLAESEG